MTFGCRSKSVTFELYLYPRRNRHPGLDPEPRFLSSGSDA